MGLHNLIRRFSKKKGFFIVIEGIDGSGKETQQDELIARLSEAGYSNTQKYDFPQYEEETSGKVKSFLTKKDDNPLSLFDILKLTNYYAEDRGSVAKQMHEQLKKADIIVSNRYSSSSKAFQGARIQNNLIRSLYCKFVDMLEQGWYDLPREDITVFLNVDVEKAQELVFKKKPRDYTNGASTDRNEDDIGLQTRAREIYLKVGHKNPKWIIVNCMDDKNIKGKKEISDLVYGAIQKYLPSKKN